MLDAARKFVIAASLLLTAGTGAHAGIAIVISSPRYAPPPARIDVRGARPFSDAVWIDGRWDWRGGRYSWVSGHWSHPAKGHHRWQSGNWFERNGSWFWTPGKWL